MDGCKKVIIDLLEAVQMAGYVGESWGEEAEELNARINGAILRAEEFIKQPTITRQEGWGDI